jgi:mRNA interferase RelE/StbE
MTYRIELKKSALKSMKKLPPADRKRIAAKIDALAENPRPKGTEKLSGKNNAFYRLRAGTYRIIYTVKDDILLVLVAEIGHRREVYRKLFT